MRIESKIERPRNEFTFRVKDKDGNVKEVGKAFNQFTDAGMWRLLEPEESGYPNQGLNAFDAAALTGVFKYCKVGSGTTAFTAASTDLTTPYAAEGDFTTFGEVVGDIIESGGDRFVVLSSVYEFAAGAIVGSVSEVGVFDKTATVLTLMAGARLKLHDGTPTSISLTSDDTLQILYKVYVKVSPEDFLSGGTIHGGYTESMAGVTLLSQARDFDFTSGYTMVKRIYDGAWQGAESLTIMSPIPDVSNFIYLLYEDDTATLRGESIHDDGINGCVVTHTDGTKTRTYTATITLTPSSTNSSYDDYTYIDIREIRFGNPRTGGANSDYYAAILKFASGSYIRKQQAETLTLTVEWSVSWT